jgi:hypothetical protein
MEGTNEEVARDIRDPGNTGNHRRRNCRAALLLTVS